MQKVIFVTDGDAIACKAIIRATKTLSIGHVILSGGNPTCCSYEDLLKKVKASEYPITVVLFDDAGQVEIGKGETLMKQLAEEEEMDIIGALAVSSADRSADWTRVDVSIDRNGQLVSQGVDKEGIPDLEDHKVHGDTVYVLDQLDIKTVVGIGDLGKMAGRDDPHKGAKITTKALKLIIERSAK